MQSEAKTPMLDVTTESFQQDVLDESQRRLVLIDFWASWCQPCLVLSPILEDLEKKYNNRFLLAKLNTEENQGLAQQFQISSIPAVKFVEKGKIVDQFVGALPEEKITALLDKYIASDDIMDAENYAKAGKYGKSLELIKAKNLTGPRAESIIWANVTHELKTNLEDREKITETLNLIPDYNSPYSAQKQAVKKFLASTPEPESTKHFLTLFDEQTQVQALDYFLSKVEKTSDEAREIAKEELFAGFAVLGNAHPLVMQYRKKLSSILF